MNLVQFIQQYKDELAVVLGATGVKIIDKLASRKAEAFQEARVIRDELRQEIENLQKQLAEQDDWREKYYQEVRKSIAIEGEVESLRQENQRLQGEIDDLRRIVDQLKPPRT